MDKDTKALTQRVAALEKIIHELRDAPGQQYNQGIHPQETSKEERNSTDWQTPTEFKIPPSPANTKQTKNPWYQSTDNWKTLLEVIAIPFAIGYAFVTYFQWQDMKSNFVVDQRAWIAYYNTGGFSSNIGAPLIFEFDLVNTGKTPAREITAEFSPTVVTVSQFSAPENWAEKKPPQQYFRVGIMVPNNPVHMKQLSVRGEDHNPLILDAALLQDLNAHRKIVMMWGQITYKDIFGKHHWFRVCREAWPPPQGTVFQDDMWTRATQTCQKYNDSDSNQ
jgi:hypothetical protein